jgi:hypothetical protein
MVVRDGSGDDDVGRCCGWTGSLVERVGSRYGLLVGQRRDRMFILIVLKDS